MHFDELIPLQINLTLNWEGKAGQVLKCLAFFYHLAEKKT